MKANWMVASALVAGLAVVPSAGARGEGKHHGEGGMHHGEGMGQAMAKALELTPEQQAQVKALREQMKQDLAPVHAQLQQKHQEMEALWKAENPDERAILAKHAEMDPLMAQARARMVHFRVQMHALLTPAQRAKAVELRAQHPRGGPGMHGGPEMGMGGPMEMADEQD